LEEVKRKRESCLNLLVVLLVLLVLGLDGLLGRNISISVGEVLVSVEHLLPGKREEREQRSERGFFDQRERERRRRGGEICSPVLVGSDDGRLSVEEIDWEVRKKGGEGQP